MGNRFGRSLNKKVALTTPVAIMVVHADSGHISQLFPSPSPLHAREVMLEHPNHYLWCLSDLQIGHQMSPIPADRCLKPAHAYVLLPMRKLRSRVSQDDLAFFLASLNLIVADDDNNNQTLTTEGESRPHKQSGNRLLPLMSSLLLPPPLLDNFRQYGVGENAHLQGCLDTATNLHRTSPLFRNRSLGLGVGLVVAEEDSEDDMLGHVMRMKRPLPWMSKLEPIKESE